MSAAKVSILIPCHNAEPFVAETLESVISQTWPNLEIIVVDDGSVDGSAAVISSFGSDRVKYIRTSGVGAAAARNIAFAHATGDFVQFLDADDLLEPHKIEAQMSALQGKQNLVAAANWVRFYHDRTSVISPTPGGNVMTRPLEWLLADRLKMLFPAMWLIPRNLVKDAGLWDERLSLCDDTEFFTRLLLKSGGVIQVGGALCYYRSGIPGSLSRRKTEEAWRSQFHVHELCEKYIRHTEESDRTRQLFAVIWQEFAFASYPYAPQLAEHALDRARNLHPIKISPDGGPKFRLLSRIIGWRMARRLQVSSGRP
jgi:glycosyltransferase involved in cell wall biosynthesis